MVVIEDKGEGEGPITESIEPVDGVLNDNGAEFGAGTDFSVGLGDGLSLRTLTTCPPAVRIVSGFEFFDSFLECEWLSMYNTIER